MFEEQAAQNLELFKDRQLQSIKCFLRSLSFDISLESCPLHPSPFKINFETIIKIILSKCNISVKAAILHFSVAILPIIMPRKCAKFIIPKAPAWQK